MTPPVAIRSVNRIEVIPQPQKSQQPDELTIQSVSASV